MRVLVTGGAGFIGSAVVRNLIHEGHEVFNLDKLTYAGSLQTVAEAEVSHRYQFGRIDVADRPAVTAAIEAFRPQWIFHLAAESHVDRSIDSSSVFISTNVVGTHVMLECARAYWNSLDGDQKSEFRFVHISTDEVYGALGPDGVFTEETAYAPNSPYAASKAAADHIARAWCVTYGLPVIITNCSNNYGPWQHPEKFIPTIVHNALSGRPIPVYGNGNNVRDWLYVDDHVAGLVASARKGKPGEKYNFGGGAERTNLQLALAICAALDRLAPRSDARPHESAISFVTDRPGHDFRYAVDASKARRELGWAPARDFESGIAETVAWCLSHKSWFERARLELGRLGLAQVT